MPSPLKSPTAMANGAVPTVIGEPVALVNDTEFAGFLTVKKTTLDKADAPGLVTVMETVLVAAMSAAVIAAVNRLPLTKVVVRGLPFQFTVAPATNPVPLTVRGNGVPPGTAVSGTSGCVIS